MREGNRIARAPAGPCLLLSSRRGSLAFSPPGRIITIMLRTKAFRDIFAPHSRYGDIFPATVSAKGLPYLFTGREFNPIDGAALKLQYSRARYYSFPLRRWLQRDLIGYAGAVGLEWAVAADPATPKLIGARTSGHFT